MAPATGLTWWHLEVSVTAAEADDAAAALVGAGAHAVHIQEGTTGVRLAASWPHADWADAQELALFARQALREVGVAPGAQALGVERRASEDWSVRWRAHFKPSKFGRRVWVVPSWERRFLPPTGSVVVELDPGMAFGTGDHATTAMCLRAVEAFVDGLAPARRAQASMLDVGCGSGILGIAALCLGLGRARALDIDPEAVAVAEQNARANAVALAVDGQPLAALEETFDLVVANILAGPLVAMAGALLARTRPGGALVLGGLLKSQADEVASAVFAAAGRRRPRWSHHWTHGEWATLRLDVPP